MNQPTKGNAMLKRLLAVLAIVVLSGCADSQQKNPDFHTSGSRQADQRAEQRIAQVQQIRGEGDKTTHKEAKRSLFERLGGEKGIQAIVDDFVPRALADPRVNWGRNGVTSGKWYSFTHRSIEWNASPENTEKLKTHLEQFLALATGGPTKYEGREMKQVHKGMKISNAEFDAAVGDLQATLDKLGLSTPDQKELLAIIESTRPQVVEQR